MLERYVDIMISPLLLDRLLTTIGYSQLRFLGARSTVVLIASPPGYSEVSLLLFIHLRRAAGVARPRLLGFRTNAC